MAFIVAVGEDLFIKRTARFGPFYGRLVLTGNRSEARAWTRESDARKTISVLEYRRGMDFLPDKKKLGGRTARVIPE